MAKPDEADEIAANTVDRPGNGPVFPTAVGADIALVLRQLADEGQDHGTRMVGNIVDTVRRIVDDHDALFPGSRQVDIIRPRR